jgi:hypothetical protein
LPEGLNAGAESFGALKGAIHNCALPDAAAAILPAKRDVHDKVKDEERFPAFWRPPNDDKTGARHEALNKIGRCRVEIDFVEGDKRANSHAIMTP